MYLIVIQYIDYSQISGTQDTNLHLIIALFYHHLQKFKTTFNVSVYSY